MPHSAPAISTSAAMLERKMMTSLHEIQCVGGASEEHVPRAEISHHNTQELDHALVRKRLLVVGVEGIGLRRIVVMPKRSTSNT